jgi:hypothetical protein
MAAIYSNGGNRWNILGFNFTKRDALSSVYKIYMSIRYDMVEVENRLKGYLLQYAINTMYWRLVNLIAQPN